MEISEQLFKFLVSFDIIPQEATRLSNQQVRLPKEMSANFENAIYFAKIAKQINRIQQIKNNLPEQPLPNIGSLKEGNKPSSKFFNWNIVLSYFIKYDISVHPDQKTLIASGDFQAANHLLDTLHQYVIKKYPDYQNYVQKTQQLSPSKQKEKENTVDLKKVQIEKDPLQTSSSLEFLIALMSKSLHLTPNQSASLMTENCKYLAHAIVKGVRGLYDPIILLFQNINEYITHFFELCLKDMKIIFIIMNALKTGMVCKNDTVAQLACNFIFGFGVEFNKRSLSNKAWDWFVNDNNNGLYTCIKCIKRHPKLNEEIVKIFYQYGQFNFVELFTTYLKVELPDTKDHMHFISTIIQPISSHPFILQEVLQNGIMEDWLEIAFECAQPYIQNDLRLEALNFLSECWINHPKKIEEAESRANQVINHLIEGCYDSSQSVLLGINCQGQLFRLLMKLGKEKNFYAPKIYKALTQILISSLENLSMREFCLINFIDIFNEIPSIPVGIMLEPYISQIQASDKIFEKLNVCDFQFLNFISRNKNLNTKLLVLLIDFLGKILLNNIIFSNIVHDCFMELLYKYYDIPSVQDYLNKFIKINLAMYYASEKKKKPKEKVLPLYNNQAASKSLVLQPSEIEQELINAQKRAKIVQLLKSIANIQSRPINLKMKPLVAHTAIQIEEFQKKENKGMMHVLEEFGDPKEIIQEYKKEYQSHIEIQKKEREEQEERENQENMKYMNDHEKKVTENLKKYALKHQKKKITLTKEEQYKLAQLRKPQETDPKILQIIEDKKKEYKAKQESDQKKKEVENQQIEKQKQQLRKQLEVRSIEQGIAAKNKPDTEANHLFEFGSREKEMKKDNKKVSPQLNYFDLNQEEDRDKLMAEALLKKYHKLFRHLFVKYSNSIQTFDNQGMTFDKLKDKAQSITSAEVWKMIKDYELIQYITQEEHKTIFKLINTNYLNKKNDFQQIDFKGFEQYIIQFSYKFCSKPPQDLRHLPISYSIEKLIEYMKSITRKQGHSTNIFEDPDKINYEEFQMKQELNKQLKQNPNTELPEGYKKVQEKELAFKYQVPQELMLPQGMKYGYEILNEIFIQALGFTLIEPKAVESTQYKASPQVKRKSSPQPHNADNYRVQDQQRDQSKSKSPQPKSRLKSKN
ncbi:hypothetical protein TTHERM_00322980 (macronuclear) [Tetrahymena thermophila SB210]|uniref:Armadillo-type fold n=1 Tax=Tetrahymena thermophila (strain SB210) TaxID=312017 RepID=Q237I7_TETTS|nr:hypothetical protein TTHERM_00322980 [Tetrahymena thermophila SB210]EAR92754.2 hypothetical protein TTHERM_00322980 [Tetrahymena thermophila SB210]|eukprot:XP_001012999.2 hypothetical protein TTHERM_00322980 [Tetrahymena thermophila SB210]